MWQKLSSSAKGFPTNRTKRVRQSYSFPRCQKATANRPHLEGKEKRASALPWFRKTAPAYSLWAKEVFFGDILVVCKLTPATPPGYLRHTLCASHGQEALLPECLMWPAVQTHPHNQNQLGQGNPKWTTQCLETKKNLSTIAMAAALEVTPPHLVSCMPFSSHPAALYATALYAAKPPATNCFV